MEYLQLFILQCTWLIANFAHFLYFVHHGSGQSITFPRYDDQNANWMWPNYKEETFQSQIHSRMDEEVSKLQYQNNATANITATTSLNAISVDVESTTNPPTTSIPNVFAATLVSATTEMGENTSSVNTAHDAASAQSPRLFAQNTVLVLPFKEVNTTSALELPLSGEQPTKPEIPKGTEHHLHYSTENPVGLATAATVQLLVYANPTAAISQPNFDSTKTVVGTLMPTTEKCCNTPASTTAPVNANNGPRDARQSANRLKQALLSSNVGSVFTHAAEAGKQLQEKYGALPAARNPAYDVRPSDYGSESYNSAADTNGNGNGYGIGNGHVNYAKGQGAKGGGGIGSGIKNFFSKLFSFDSKEYPQHGYEKYHMPAAPDTSVLPINPPVVTLRINADFVELDCIAYGQIQYGLRWVKLVGLNPYGHELFATVADGERVLMDTYHYAVRTDGKHSRLIIRNPDPRLHYGIYECQATVAGSPNVVVKEDFVVGRVA